ncbi:MAG TPA: hypothetical protein DDW47_04255 [Lactobacillus acetotolerans]|uniref:Uncharacterized protein n=1 Tax=Lactobacillus acetotolerans TaxID=1600 RepID=A0A353UB95_9LACO|nr:hypothetical protein LA749_04875 [Lactobacillus acetotolerans]HBG91281.1 hypothetical protein [Lactobacillus acetotolerans]HCX39863.1 hypothetical protein [Lactobacillus acetotolerans]
MAAFIPGASPPLVKIPIRFMNSPHQDYLCNFSHQLDFTIILYKNLIKNGLICCFDSLFKC